MTLFTFAAYFWLEDQILDAGKVFASLALFSQLTVPLLIFPVMIPIIINAMVNKISNNKRNFQFLLCFSLILIQRFFLDFHEKNGGISSTSRN